MDDKLRVLLVQKKWNSIATLEKELLSEGIACNLEETHFGADILERIEKHNPDVLLINCVDSAVETIDLCRKVSQKLKSLPVIVLSRISDEHIALTALKEGADDYVFLEQLRRLAASVRRAIKLKSLQREIELANIDKQKARSALRQSRRIRNIVIENTSDLVCELDLDGNLIGINKPLGSGLGYSLNELLGKNPIELIHPEDREKVLRTFKEALISRKGKNLSFRCRDKNGQWRYLESSGGWVFDSNGQPQKAIVVCKDVTEKKLAEEALKLSQQYASAIINSSIDMIIAVDINRRIIEFNPAAERTFGYKKEDVLGRVADILYANPAEGIAISQKIINEGYYKGEVTNVRKNGEVFTSLLSASLLKDSEGMVVGIMGISRDISREKQTQKELDESKTRFQSLVESVNVIPWESDFQNKRLLYIGKQVEKILGYPAESWRKPNFWEDHIHPEDRNYVINYSLAAAERYDNYESEYRMIAADGRIVWIHDIINVLRDGGKPVRLRGFMIDVTAKKETEESLRQLNVMLNTLIDASPLGIIVFDLDGIVKIWNNAAEKILGWRAADIIGSQIPVELASEIPEEFCIRDSIGRPGTVYTLKERQFKRLDGGVVTITLWCAPVVDQNGITKGMLYLIADITEHKRVLEQMQKLANFSRFNPFTVLELDETGRITYFNDAAMQMAQSLGKRHPSEILPPETPEIVRHCLVTGQSWLRMEITVGERTISWSFFPISQNNVVHCYASDITDRVKLESQLRQSQKMECVGQLAAGVAHDFNNILTIIQGHTGMLLMMKDKLSSSQVESLQQISIAAEKGANLTRQLLTFSKRQIIQPKFIDIGELVLNMSKMIKRLLGETIKEEFDIEKGLPTIWADSGMIEQVIMNLAINARDAMPNGGRLFIGLKQIHIDSHYVRNFPQGRPGHFVCLTVRDTGCGMDENVMSHLFEPFFTTKEIGKGTGLGLATVYGIVRQHEGWIEVTSQPGKGSEFRIYLPAYSQVKEKETKATVQTESIGGHELILVVEDEDPVRQLIHSMLAQYGYRVLEAANGREALAIWSENRDKIDLLITDLVMPEGISGKELAERILMEKPDLKVLYISGYSPEIAGTDFEEKSGKFYLQKPFSLHTLIKFVRYCLDSPKSA